MLLLLVRHADADNRDAGKWPDDTLRPLSEKGRKIHAKVAKALGGLGLLPELVLTSPWLRAAQTAEILQQGLGLPSPPVPCLALASDPDLVALDSALGPPRAEKAVVALVGHSPWMEELVGLLLTGAAHGLGVDFPKSGVAGIAADRIGPRAGTLRFFLRPKML
jgi:phosphohistidine phosphatase